jgi:ATP-dependent protease HslVU (ClpYQ) peptidase subunit
MLVLKLAKRGLMVDEFNDSKNAPKLENSAFLVAYKQKVFFIDNYFVQEINDYYAIGVGMDYALAALYLGASVKEAIEVACHLSIFCEKPVNVIEMKKQKQPWKKKSQSF